MAVTQGLGAMSLCFGKLLPTISEVVKILS